MWRALPVGGLLGLLALVLALLLPRAPATGAALDLPTLTAGPFTFMARDYTLRPLSPGAAPFAGRTAVKLYATREARGVVMQQGPGGELYDHPVRQAQTVVNALRNLAVTGDEGYRELAVVNAERLVSRSTRVGEAMFFPYPLDFYLHGRGMLRAPWYSGMGQGIALSGFVKLYRVTGDARWLQAADGAFASFLVPARDGRPWVTMVDDGLLWFEEYPWHPPDHTYNGHNFALYGLYDYWLLTGDADAQRLLLGGLTTAEVVAPLVRWPGGASHYCLATWCLASGARNPDYHWTHVGQLQMLHRMTGAHAFRTMARQMAEDMPR